MVARWTWQFELVNILLTFYCFLAGMAYFNVRGRSIRSRATFRGGFRGSEKYIRSDNNFFAVLRDSLPEENGDDHETFTSVSDDGFTVVRSKRQRIYGYFTIRVANIIGNYLVKFMNTSGVPFTT